MYICMYVCMYVCVYICMSVILFEQGIDRWLRAIQSLATEETNPMGLDMLMM